MQHPAAKMAPARITEPDSRTGQKRGILMGIAAEKAACAAEETVTLAQTSTIIDYAFRFAGEIILWRDHKVPNPLPGMKLCSQPAGLFASATPCFGGLVWVTVFRENSRIRSTAALSSQHCFRLPSELLQALFKDALLLGNPRGEHSPDLIFQRA
jgi:hypothetical protein